MGFIQYELKSQDLFFFYQHENDEAFYPKDQYTVKTAEP